MIGPGVQVPLTALRAGWFPARAHNPCVMVQFHRPQLPSCGEGVSAVMLRFVSGPGEPGRRAPGFFD